MKKVKIIDKWFEVSITSIEIQKAIINMATKMNNDFKGKEIVFVCILNGAFMFASDLLKKINLNCTITFLKLSSYEGTSSSGKIKKLIGINEDLKGKTVVVLEDIVDTGTTIENIVNQLKENNAKEIKVATLLFKPNAYKGNIKIDYAGLEMPNDFIIGYGLDYNGYGRNLKEIYTLTK